MNLYLDTSTLVKLYVEEQVSEMVRDAVARAELVAISAVGYLEARSAFVRRRHEGALTAGGYRRSMRDLEADWARYLVVEVTEAILGRAAQLAERHRLRAYDALHLASALVLKSRLAEPVIFACWDRRLERAARAEGLGVLRSAR